MQVILEFEWSLHSVLFKVKDPLPVEKQSKVVYIPDPLLLWQGLHW